jgi:hypothetical protein
MSADRFRRVALDLPEAVEGSHGGHPDFRVGKRVFASLFYPDKDWGMVKLTPEQQADFMEKTPAAFAPCRGTWGLRGATCVHLASVTKSTLQPALEAAHLNVSTPAKRKPRS